MKNIVAIIFTTFISNFLFGQSNQPGMVDKAVLDKINRQVSIEALQYKKQLVNHKIDNERITFCVDTFIINHIETERITENSSTLFVNKSIIGAINAYDSLLQQYYFKLYSLLADTDKERLSASKKAWQDFQKAEINLIGTLRDTKYSGGGTIQTNIEGNLENKILIERLDQIFNYYDSIVKSR